MRKLNSNEVIVDEIIKDGVEYLVIEQFMDDSPVSARSIVPKEEIDMESETGKGARFREKKHEIKAKPDKVKSLDDFFEL